MTYGVSSAFLKIRSLHQAAHNACDSHPNASQVILRDFYVDDLLTGHDDLDKLRALKHEITTVLKSAGFELSKWRSSEPTLFERDTEEFVRKLPPVRKESKRSVSFRHQTETHFNTTHENNSHMTKRTVLSIVSQIFDPMGLVGQLRLRQKLSYKNCGN